MTSEATERRAVDAVVVSWNNRDLTLDCLQHIAASSVPTQLIVVDNGSEDGTVEAVRERFPDATVVALEQNIGYGPAINRGIAAGSGEFIALINNDANIEPEFLARTLTHFDADEKVGSVGGISLNPANGRIDAAGILLDGGLAGYLHLTGEPLDELDLTDPRLIAPAHVNVVYRRATLEDVGGFDEEIFAYCEEIDLAMRVRRAGWGFAIDERARSVHIGSATLGTRSINQVRLAAWGRGYVAGRYRIGPLWLLTEIAVGLADSVVQRSFVPLTRRVAGWRHGRSLGRRRPPEGIEYVSWIDGMRLRKQAV